MNNQHSAHSAPIPSQPRSQRRHSAAERANWVGMYERSGQTLKAFCMENGVALSTLMLWRRQIRGPLGGRRTRGTLIEVPLAPQKASIPLGTRTDATPAVMIHVPNGLRVEVAPSTDAQWVAALLNAVCQAGRAD